MRNELITMINNILDENTDLKVRNAFLEAKENERNKDCCNSKADIKGYSKLDEKIIEYGKKELADKLLNSYSNQVRVSRDESTKELKFTTFDNWYKDKIYEKYIPKNMSYEEAKELIYPYAVEKYEKEKVEAIKSFEESENTKEDE